MISIGAAPALTTFALGLLLLVNSPAGAQEAGAQRTALWCIPAVYEHSIKVAEACGLPVSPDARIRSVRMTEAYFNAVARLRGAETVTAMRRAFDTMTDDSGEVANGLCSGGTRGIERLVRQLETTQADAIVRGYEFTASEAQDPAWGECL